MTLISNLQTWWQTRHASAWTDWPDGDLLEHYRTAGSTAAMDLLIRRHCNALYHFLLTLADPVLAEDISQQVWTGLIERPDQYQAQAASFRTWLFTVGRNRTVDELRRQQRWQWPSTDDSAIDRTIDDEHVTLTFTERDDLNEAFDQALTALPFVQREAISLQLEGFSLADIALITHDKPETIKSRLRFARQQLKHSLEENHD
ncbi:sigma-70 family RNA polymerase sigma factor [Reinekea blandensis]|uniref:RNA polymerase sigma-70 factor n=1 Tax=Reinekea blandensis MED297 TaxID=314283 RepID=A4BJU6_9GAMM|nr:sigma-70 family RNA polymerase sigma factor [Reinekea blandensis]EAR07613.1 RNA polymerase sigma-70 factor [Reinekea sp. MED297] [Reinekea blandensis MED297]